MRIGKLRQLKDIFDPKVKEVFRSYAICGFLADREPGGSKEPIPQFFVLGDGRDREDLEDAIIFSAKQIVDERCRSQNKA